MMTNKEGHQDNYDYSEGASASAAEMEETLPVYNNC